MQTETKIVEGWVFYTADFSMQAITGRKDNGCVTLVRSPADKRRWLAMSDDLHEADDGPPLYVYGNGVTFADAIEAANRQASDALPIPAENNP